LIFGPLGIMVAEMIRLRWACGC